MGIRDTFWLTLMDVRAVLHGYDGPPRDSVATHLVIIPQCPIVVFFSVRWWQPMDRRGYYGPSMALYVVNFAILSTILLRSPSGQISCKQR